MNNAILLAVCTVTAIVVVEPALSRTTTLALPAATPVTVRLVPDKPTVATLALLLVAV